MRSCSATGSCTRSRRPTRFLSSFPLAPLGYPRAFFEGADACRFPAPNVWWIRILAVCCAIAFAVVSACVAESCCLIRVVCTVLTVSTGARKPMYDFRNSQATLMSVGSVSSGYSRSDVVSGIAVPRPWVSRCNKYLNRGIWRVQVSFSA